MNLQNDNFVQVSKDSYILVLFSVIFTNIKQGGK